MTVCAARLPGDRLHLQHGPIDLILGADGARDAAFAAATARFDGLLEELMAENALLRAWDGPRPEGPVARRMWQAVNRFPGQATPMAAVAGAVAEEVLAAMTAAAPLFRAWVNNGGDIALHLAQGQSFRIAMAGGRIAVTAGDPVRGIATSGRGGRSLSMGIADSVTVLASTAALADAAATLIANAVDLPGHPAIRRAPADTVKDDSDLGSRPVVTGLGALSAAEVREALDRGAARAQKMQAEGHIAAAALFLRGQSRTVGARHHIEAKESAHG
ncbi:hypothetical protein [Oceaniglobus roseus]|uniref:hypothetical protein n=1 Tax=Oceaniglobus roseus TaxID=1737570 RepID=UPI000C7F1A0C|nr:hypothetical protein [Kandeliimicrobium roseum]